MSPPAAGSGRGSTKSVGSKSAGRDLVPPDIPPQVLRDYSVLADGERGALVGPRGEINWLCAPRWDDDAVFASLIGGKGLYAVTPAERFVWGGHYEEGSMIWRSRWVTASGVTESREALAFPGEPERAIVLRRIIASDCDAHLVVQLNARAEFGEKPMRDLKFEDGIWTMKTGDLCLRWQGGEGAQVTGSRSEQLLVMELVVPCGQEHDFVLEIAHSRLPDEPAGATRCWRMTEAAWKDAVPDLAESLSPVEVRHSYAVLRGLTCPSGGTVAALTTSLPERAQAGRNYDYRFVWIRDQCYVAHALAAAEDERLLKAAVKFVADRLNEYGPELAPAYTVEGKPVPDQRALDLPGYPGGFDRVGNWVNKQFQLDAFGESLLLFADAERFDLLDPDARKASEVAAEAIAARWREPDAGIWEIDNQPWTHSRLTASAGLRAISAIAGPPRPSGDLLRLADEILADTAKNASHPDGHWQRAPDDPKSDGSLLLVGIRGAVPPGDPRSAATLEAYCSELTEDGYAYRFRHDNSPLGDAEGSFTLCGFLVSMACHLQGDAVRARGWWERTRASCGPPMLYSEEYDAAEHQMRGNLPQTFVHAAMVESAVLLAH